MAKQFFTPSELCRLAEDIERLMPEKAAELRKLAETGAEGVVLNISFKFKLEKFNGEHVLGDVPVETIEGSG